LSNSDSGSHRLLTDPNLHVIFGVTLMAVLGVSTITPVLPEVATVFERTPQAVALLIVVFTLPGVVFTPILGVVGDRLGRKRVLVPSLFLFALAGTICGFARDFETLLVLRFLQGVGAGALGAINVTLLGDLYRGAERVTAMGYNASVLSIGTGIYPAVGGGLSLLGWYFPFFLPVLAIPIAITVLMVLNNPEPEPTGSIATYTRVALRSIIQPQVLTLFATSVVTFVLIYGSFLAYFPFLLERRFAASPVFIGAVMSVTSVATAITAFWLGTLSRSWGSRALVKAGFVLYALALALIPFASNVWQLAAPVLLFGVANGLNVPSILIILNGYAPSEYRAAFMSINGMLLRLGQTLGPLLVGAAVRFVGTRGSFLVSAALALATLLLILPVLRPEETDTA
jgi:ACDE family multidrug resistance protein